MCLDTRELEELIRAGSVPRWAQPEDPERFFELLAKDDLTDNDIDEVIDAAGRPGQEICDQQWELLSEKIELEQERRDPKNAGCENGEGHCLPRWVVEILGNALQWRLYNKVGDWQLAEDLTQEAFLKAHRKWKSYSPEKGSVKAWVFKIADNITVDQARKRRRVPVPMDPEGIERLIPTPSGPDSADKERRGAGDDRRSEATLEGIDLTPAERRLVTAQMQYPDATAGELADVLGTTANNVYVTRNRAFTKMRRTRGGDNGHVAIRSSG